ncbi:MAG: prephenate dehydrogenase/arogenate dehydrogenase family protein [Candidatus Lokiarchaeota archaeon]|nr:prephenate dehydrogenase/arogenate dehydrogenase family protein [Candidatus Lokiarchaeota archaeon]
MLGKNMTIIGGSGGMGKVFGRLFQKYGFEITLFARNKEKLIQTAIGLNMEYSLDLEECVKKADVIMVSIPITSTPQMIKKIAPLMKRDAILFDITSLKTLVYSIMQELCSKYPINCLSLHPMFGPGIKDMNNYVMISIKIGGTNNYNLLIEELFAIFQSEGLLIITTTPEEHDKTMALTLAVPHMVNILYLTLLKQSGIPLNDLTKFTGTTFLLQKVFAESIIQREMEMFGEIQMENPEFYKILDLFEGVVSKYKTMIQSKDKNAFNKTFQEGLEYSREDNHFKNSYKYFYEFMKILKK